MAKLSEKKKKELAAAALEVRKRAYAPFSGHAVGADTFRTIATYCCNIENSAYSPTICAERAAFAKAISEGVREFTAIAVAGGFEEVPEGYCAPCGVCRQVMAEFCGKGFIVLLARTPEDRREYTLEEIFPLAFKIEDTEGRPLGKEAP